VEYKGINLDTLQELIDRKKLKAVTVKDLMENGLAGKRDLVKILGRGELKSGVSIQAHKFSASARTAIEAAGGEAAEA
jgi:large subunit ribosomal protein L15